MFRTARTRLTALGLGTLVGLGSWYALRPPDAGLLRLDFDGGEIDRVLRERASETLPAGVDPGPGQRQTVPRAVAERLFSQIAADNVWNEYDPYTVFRSRAGLDRRVPLPAHPAGSIRLRTNSLGLRQDDEVASERPDLRVLLAGDSHTEGACDNSESFASLLEGLLEEAFPEQSTEVVNAGKAGFSFYNYRGTLDRFRDLEPHVFVCVVYAGNDFYEVLLLDHWHRRTRPPERWTHLDDLRAAVHDVQPSALGQSLLQLEYLSLFPVERERALRAAVELTLEMARVSEERSVRFVCVLLPAMADVQPEYFDPDLDGACEALALDARARATTEELTDAWIAEMDRHSVPVVDLRPEFRAATERLYWAGDHHLNLRGNALVAEVLLRSLAGS